MAQFLTNTRPSLIVGFADLSIAEIAADYDLSVEEVMVLCQQLGITYRNPQTRLALEDAKAVISQILARSQNSGAGSG